MTGLLVALAGGLGAGCRYLLEFFVTMRIARSWPVGTLVVNVMGSAAAGMLAAAVLGHGLDEQTALVVGTGFLSAFTTFSTFAIETVALASTGNRRAAVLNVAASTVLSIAAAAFGYWLIIG